MITCIGLPVHLHVVRLAGLQLDARDPRLLVGGRRGIDHVRRAAALGEVLVDHVRGRADGGDLPVLSSTHRLVSVEIACMLWLTNSTVRPRPWRRPSSCPGTSSGTRASPTASTSSTIRISGSRWAATANASRTYIPEEYRFTGVSRNLLDLGERDDLVELALDLRPLHAQDRAVEVDVLAAGQLRVEAGADLQQRRDPPAQHGPPVGRLGDPAEDLQQRALARAVAADQPDHLAARSRRSETSRSAQNASFDRGAGPGALAQRRSGALASPPPARRGTSGAGRSAGPGNRPCRSDRR